MNDLRFAPGGPGIEPRWTRGTKLAVGVATGILGIDGLGQAEVFADFSQWEIWQGAQAGEKAAAAEAGEKPAASVAARPATGKKKLSYIEAREYEGIERRVVEAEEVLKAKQAALEDPAIASDGPRLIAAAEEVVAAQKAVDALYARWAELEQKL